MADFLRMQISANDAGALPKQAVTNTIYLRRGDNPVTPEDDQALANDLLAVVIAATSFWAGCKDFQVKAYDLENAPGPPVAIATGQRATVTSTNANREQALCLSFRGATNTARQRGRIYLGPLFGTPGVRPTTSYSTPALDLATAFGNLGGTDVDWCVYSRSSVVAGALGPAFHPVKLAWVDDEWDVQRSRGLGATTRWTRTLDE